VDHASRFLHFTPHISTGADEAIAAKLRFELLASGYDRRIKCYHTDNGIFTTKHFHQHCLQNHQQITFCGVNAHHQKGIAEQYIRTITEHARSMLIHAMISWPDIIQENLWPFALRLKVDLHNSTPGVSGLSPEELFSGNK
jgi:hypothetical protein